MAYEESTRIADGLIAILSSMDIQDWELVEFWMSWIRTGEREAIEKGYAY